MYARSFLRLLRRKPKKKEISEPYFDPPDNNQTKFDEPLGRGSGNASEWSPPFHNSQSTVFPPPTLHVHGMCRTLGKKGESQSERASKQPRPPPRPRANSFFSTLLDGRVDVGKEMYGLSDALSRQVHAACCMRNAFLRRVASEEIYDVARKSSFEYFYHFPELDPTLDSARINLLRRLDEIGWVMTELTDEELRIGFRLGVIDIESLVEEAKEKGKNQLQKNLADVSEKVNCSNVKDISVSTQPKLSVDPTSQDETEVKSLRPPDEIPWPMASLVHEARAMLRGSPSLDIAASLSKGKHVSDPREFTQEDLMRLAKWDADYLTREILNDLFGYRNKFFQIDPVLAKTMEAMQKIKKETLEDSQYQKEIAFVQSESDHLREEAIKNFSNPTPWKAKAADHVYFFQDPFSRVPRRGFYNLPPVSKNVAHPNYIRRRFFFRHQQIEKAKPLQRAIRSFTISSPRKKKSSEV